MKPSTTRPLIRADLMADDAMYLPAPDQAVGGRENIRGVVGYFFKVTKNFVTEIRAIATSGSLVLVERVDRFELEGSRVDRPCAGVFEVLSDKIARW